MTPTPERVPAAVAPGDPDGLALPRGWRRWPEEAKRDMQYALFRRRYRNDLAAFAVDCIDWPDGERPAPYQLEILEALPEVRKLAIRGPHGLGKTCVAAILVLGYALTRDREGSWKVPTTASNWRQLQHYLWPEIHLWRPRLRWDRIGRAPWAERREWMWTAIRGATGEAFAAAARNEAEIEGAHADALLYVLDEARSIKPALWEAVEGAFSGARGSEMWALAMSTPREESGVFYEIHAGRKVGWQARHVTLAEAVAAGRIDPGWAQDRADDWGPESATYRARVLGDFTSSEHESVIPHAWVTAAEERWRERMAAAGVAARHTVALGFDATRAGELFGMCTALGVDVADVGRDKSIIALRYGPTLLALQELAAPPRAEAGEPEMITAGRVIALLRERGGRAVIDAWSIGAGVAGVVRDAGYDVVAHRGGERSSRKDRSGHIEFENRRAEAWWGLRDALHPERGDAVALPPLDRLRADLTAPRWHETARGNVVVESKDQVRERLGRSPDMGDAAVLAFWSGATGRRIHSPVGHRIDRR